MNLKNYENVDRRHISPYPVYLVTPGYGVFLRDYLNSELDDVIMFFDKGMWNIFIDVKKWRRLKRRSLKFPKGQK